VNSTSTARWWHLVTLVVAVIALVFQFWLIVQGNGILDEQNVPSLGEQIRRYFFYFTIQSNLAVAWGELMIVRRPDVDTRLFRVVRLASVLGIAVTGVVHWFFLRPLLDLQGSDYVADKLLHVVVPLLAVVGWLVWGPRHRVRRSDILPALGWPVLWLVVTLAIAPLVDDFYPYPFLDVQTHGWGTVLVNSVAIAVLFFALCFGALWLDRRLPDRNPGDSESTRA
jgi:hypothetical protein